jgi:hypothetical protein
MGKLNLEPRQVSQEAEDLVNELLDITSSSMDEVGAWLIQAAAQIAIETESFAEMMDYLDSFIKEGV